MSRLGVNRPWVELSEDEQADWRDRAQLVRTQLAPDAACLQPDELATEWQVCQQHIQLISQHSDDYQTYAYVFRHLWRSWCNLRSLLHRWGYSLSHPLLTSTGLACDHFVWFQAIYWGQTLQQIRDDLGSVWMHPTSGWLVVYFSQARYLNTEAFYEAMEAVMTVDATTVLLVTQHINISSNLHYIDNEIAHFRGHGKPVDIQLLRQAHLRICHQLATLVHRIVPEDEHKTLLQQRCRQNDGQAVTLDDLPKLLASDVQCFLFNIKPGQLVEIQVPRDNGWFPEYRWCVTSNKSSFKLAEKFDNEMRKCWQNK
jgi:DNA-directed RNA polymerase subunit H (RpoH/RPB5)